MFERASRVTTKPRTTESGRSAALRAPQRSRTMVQAKLVVGASNDSCEHEADRIARQVTEILRQPDSGQIAGGTMPASATRITRRTNGSVETAQPARSTLTAPATRITRRAAIDSAGATLDSDTEQQISQARSGGAPLDTKIRRRMEGAFGADFSNVRMHVGPQSDELNNRIQAKAFTSGSDIFVRRQDYAPGTNAGDSLLAHELTHTLQQGGSTVARLVQRAAAEEEASEGETSEGEADEALADAEMEAEEEESESDDPGAVKKFSIGNIAPPEAKFTIGEGMGKEDAARKPRQASAKKGSAAGVAKSAPTTMELVPNLSTGESISERTGGSAGGAKDAVNVSKVATKTSINGGKNVDAFGEEGTSFTMSGLSVTWKKSKILVSGTLNGDFTWGVNGGGAIDVKSATDPIITASNYKAIVADLTPKLVEKSWRAPRSKYWSQAICERHEKFHAKDDTKWFKSKGKGIIAKYLKLNPVVLADGDSDDLGVVKTKTEAAMTDALEAVTDANMEFYTGGAASYFSYAGEERAFGDGKAPYLKLASAITKQGVKLEKAAAKEGAKEKGKAETPTTATPPTEPVV